MDIPHIQLNSEDINSYLTLIQKHIAGSVFLGEIKSLRTLTASAGHLREGVVTAVALSPNYTRLAGAITRLWVAASGVGTQMEAVTREACVAAFRSIVVVLHFKRYFETIIQEL